MEGLDLETHLTRRTLKRDTMTSYKLLIAAAVGTLSWMGVSAVCFANLATVKPNLAIISQQRVAPAAPAPNVPELNLASAPAPAAARATP